METKKISFGFMKTKKADKPIIEEKRDYIDCLEEKSIKVIGGDAVEEKTPLIIPMKPNTLITAERLQQIASEVESSMQEPEPSDKPPEPEDVPNNTENETIDQMVARELIEGAKKEIQNETTIFTVPLTLPTLTGEKESTLDDYEAVPVSDFGMAMLRGMGWTSNKEKSTYKQPELRPKGLGLGADKVIKANKSKTNKKDEENELMIVKNAFVKITIGKYSGYYGKVLSLDEDTGRVLVDVIMKKETVSLNEFMMQPVTKTEFDQQSRVLNADKYEQYKNSESTTQKKVNTQESNSKYNRESSSRHMDRELNNEFNRRDTRIGTDKHTKNGKEKNSRHRSSSKEHKSRYNKEESSKYSSNETLNSLSETEKKSRHRQKDKERKQRHNSSSDERSPSRSKEKNKQSRRKDNLSNTKTIHKRKEKKKYASTDSLDSVSDYSDKKDSRRNSSELDSSDSYRHKKTKKNKKDKRTSPPVGKRDIDKKRKGKKKKRDRDRSPNYKKHRK